MCSLFQAIAGRPVKSNITVHLPAALKQAAKNVNNVACTFFKNISLLQVRLFAFSRYRHIWQDFRWPYLAVSLQFFPVFTFAILSGILLLLCVQIFMLHCVRWRSSCVCFFQEAHKTAKPINDVVEITVENEIIRNLPEPIRIDFYHEAVSVSLCVSVAFSLCQYAPHPLYIT